MQDNYAIHFYKVEEKHCVYSILPNMGFAACFSMYYSKHLQYAVMHGVSHIPAQKRKLVVITALLMCHLMQIALRSNNCKAQEAVASAGWLQRASSPLIYPLQSEGAILFSTDGTQHQDWLNTNLAPPSVFSCLLWITDSRQCRDVSLFSHPFFFWLLPGISNVLSCSLVVSRCHLGYLCSGCLDATSKVIQKCSKYILITI